MYPFIFSDYFRLEIKIEVKSRNFRKDIIKVYVSCLKVSHTETCISEMLIISAFVQLCYVNVNITIEVVKNRFNFIPFALCLINCRSILYNFSNFISDSLKMFLFPMATAACHSASGICS